MLMSVLRCPIAFHKTASYLHCRSEERCQLHLTVMLVGTQERARDLTGVGYLYKGLRADSPETEAENSPPWGLFMGFYHGCPCWGTERVGGWRKERPEWTLPKFPSRPNKLDCCLKFLRTQEACLSSDGWASHDSVLRSL